MIMRMSVGKMDGPGRGLPAAPGSYLLVLSLDLPQRIGVGALGTFHFPAGSYVYCGSALGAGGIRARAERHLECRSPAHWHIDFLLRCARLHGIWIREDSRRLECLWAGALAENPLCRCAAPRFGATDCRCHSHLWRLPRASQKVAAVLASLPFPPVPALVLPAS